MLIGIIGLGEMGRMYAKVLAANGYEVIACDKEENYAPLKSLNLPLTIVKDGHQVSRMADYIIYCVEAENIAKVVQLYGPSSKLKAIVGGQTSCKAPEVEAFTKYLPEDVEIVSCHSLHGPAIDPKGQPLAVVPVRASSESVDKVKKVLSCFGSLIVDLSPTEHDRITADTQAVTHAAFLSMGSAWCANKEFPWEDAKWTAGIENVKINLTLRIYSNQWHVYAGLAILNPSAQHQIKEYARSVTELFKLMCTKDTVGLKKRIYAARDYVFAEKKEPLLRDDLLDQFSLNPREHKSPPKLSPVTTRNGRLLASTGYHSL